MLESILYFLLGFLAAGLLALMISPVIWQKAVSLTKRRIERSIPLTLNEVQADKDQLRAEFAMSTRRLEISVDDLREKAATQIIEINRKRDDIARLAEEQGEKIHVIEELQAKSGELRILLQQREEQLERTNQRLSETQENMEEKALQFEEMRQRFEKAKTDSDGRKIELVAKQTELDNLSDQLKIHDLTSGNSSAKDKTVILKTELAKTKAQLTALTKEQDSLAQKLDATTKQLAANSTSLDRRERELSQLREAAGSNDLTNSTITAQLVDQQSRNVELEAKLAHSNLQMEALLHDASNDNVEKAMASMEQEKSNLATRLDTITGERDSLKEELGLLSSNRQEEWETERRENSILRERINDLAAQVTAMTASLEGDTSPINEILSRKENTKNPRSKKADKADKKITLADRIRALQDAAG